MKKLLLASLVVCYGFLLQAQTKSFRFIHISDTHIGSPDGVAEEDLRRTVESINAMQDIAFVIITGDITELGTNEEIALAKQILDGLKVKYYIIPGNHDSGWSESGGVSFSRVFGNDKFVFDYNGVRFIGCASGPYVRMSDGHIPRDAIVWLDSLLAKTPTDMPVVFCNHYPLDNSLDNWYEAIDRLKSRHTILAICGHGHRNKVFSFEGIPGIMGRSNLRAKEKAGGFNIVDVRSDSIIYYLKRPGEGSMHRWAGVEVKKHDYSTAGYERPDYALNKKYPQVKSQWLYASSANVISTPVVTGNKVIVGNQQGEVIALSLKNGRQQWSYKTGGAVFSSPAAKENRIVLGSGDGSVYCLDAKDGQLVWHYQTGASVLGSPVIAGDTVFIGGSDHHFYALDIKSGQPYWSFDGLNGPVVSTPLLYAGMVIFGAWDTNLYALDRSDGKLLWKWNSGSSIINYSPASCIPVASRGVVYVVAPDRNITAIDAVSGQALWRNNETRVRESIGISEDGQYIYGKTMQDTIVAYAASRQPQSPAWVMHAGFGYEHVPSMLIEKDGQLFFGTRNGVVYDISLAKKTINWAYKIDNSMVNTVQVLDSKTIVASTMDGKITLLKVKK